MHLDEEFGLVVYVVDSACVTLKSAYLNARFKNSVYDALSGRMSCWFVFRLKQKTMIMLVLWCLVW